MKTMRYQWEAMYSYSENRCFAQTVDANGETVEDGTKGSWELILQRSDDVNADTEPVRDENGDVAEVQPEPTWAAVVQSDDGDYGNHRDGFATFYAAEAACFAMWRKATEGGAS